MRTYIMILFLDSAVVNSGSISSMPSESAPSTPNSFISEANHSGNKFMSLPSCSTPGMLTESSSVHSVHCKLRCVQNNKADVKYADHYC